jgi:gliding motility associated protien GldN
MNKVFFFLGLISLNGLSQPYGPPHFTENGTPDGFPAEHVITRKMIPYEYVREADVIWSKRVWRAIDLREKMNHPLFYPMDDFSGGGVWLKPSLRWSLWTIIRENVFNGNLVPFDPENPYALGTFDGDQFKYPISVVSGKTYATDSVFQSKVFRLFGQLSSVSLIPLTSMEGEDSVRLAPNGLDLEVVYAERDTVWFKSSDIVQYHLKEDWFFDKERSVMDVRILGIAPVVYKRNAANQIEGMRELFWLYFPHCRFVFNNYFAYNTKNDAQWMSFDDLFWKRQFSSYIIKESNVFDRKIEQYRSGVDAQIESQRISEEIRMVEHDVWHF